MSSAAERRQAAFRAVAYDAIEALEECARRCTGFRVEAGAEALVAYSDATARYARQRAEQLAARIEGVHG